MLEEILYCWGKLIEKDWNIIDVTNEIFDSILLTASGYFHQYFLVPCIVLKVYALLKDRFEAFGTDSLIVFQSSQEAVTSLPTFSEER